MFHLEPDFSAYLDGGVLIAQRSWSASLLFTKQLITCQTGVDTSSRSSWSVFRAPDTIWLSLAPAILAPFRPRDQEIIIPVYLSPRRRCHSQSSAGTLEASVGAARGRCCDRPALQTLKERLLLQTWVFKTFLEMMSRFFLFFHLPAALHVVYLSRCSLGGSRYLQHPPIICFTSFLTPPSPMLASPLILNLDHPSAA